VLSIRHVTLLGLSGIDVEKIVRLLENVGVFIRMPPMERKASAFRLLNVEH
jgi:hypothetical protein